MRYALRRRLALASTIIPLILTVTGCSDSPMEGDDEPEVASMRLTVGSQIITVADNGAVTGGPITFTGTVNVSAEFLRADASPDPLVTDAAFQLNAEPVDGTIITFTRSAAFTGTLTSGAPGSTQIAFALFHKAEMHEDFGPFNVPVTIP